MASTQHLILAENKYENGNVSFEINVIDVDFETKFTYFQKKTFSATVKKKDLFSLNIYFCNRQLQIHVNTFPQSIYRSYEGK